MQKEFKLIEDWLKKDGNSIVKLAAIIGYKSSTTISKWFSRGAIPEHMRSVVVAALKKGSKK